MTRKTCRTPGCTRPVNGGGLCGACTMRSRRPKRPGAEERFWLRVDRQGPPAALRPDLGPCWLWLGPRTDAGYGICWWQGATRHVGRIAWAIAWGELPPRSMRLKPFACGVGHCANPGHWRPDVAVDNVMGARNLARWCAEHDSCPMGHQFTPRNTILVPGGRACRACRREVERVRR